MDKMNETKKEKELANEIKNLLSWNEDVNPKVRIINHNSNILDTESKHITIFLNSSIYREELNKIEEFIGTEYQSINISGHNKIRIEFVKILD